MCSEVRNRTEQIRLKHERYQELVRTCDTSSSVEFKDFRKGRRFVLFKNESTNRHNPAFVKELRDVDRKLKGLKDAVEVVSRDGQ